jgi:hypothetical protein
MRQPPLLYTIVAVGLVPTLGKSACAAWVLIGLGCLLGPGIRAESASPEVPVVNLYRGEINGTLFSTMTADTIRSTFGSPSVIEALEGRQEGQRTHIQYHALGLSFEMHHSREQSPLQCWRVRIYLTKTWDAKASMVFLPFPGRLSKQVSQDWTPQRIETEFRQWYPKSYPQEQAIALVNEAPRAQAAQATYRVLYLDMVDFRIDFFYAQTEQRLHAIELTPPPP